MGNFIGMHSQVNWCKVGSGVQDKRSESSIKCLLIQQKTKVRKQKRNSVVGFAEGADFLQNRNWILYLLTMEDLLCKFYVF